MSRTDSNAAWNPKGSSGRQHGSRESHPYLVASLVGQQISGGRSGRPVRCAEIVAEGQAEAPSMHVKFWVRDSEDMQLEGLQLTWHFRFHCSARARPMTQVIRGLPVVVFHVIVAHFGPELCSGPWVKKRCWGRLVLMRTPWLSGSKTQVGTQTDKDKQTDGRTERQTDRWTAGRKQTDRQTDRQRDGHKLRERERGRGRETASEREETEWEREREKESGRQEHRQTEGRTD